MAAWSPNHWTCRVVPQPWFYSVCLIGHWLHIGHCILRCILKYFCVKQPLALIYRLPPEALPQLVLSFFLLWLRSHYSLSPPCMFPEARPSGLRLLCSPAPLGRYPGHRDPGWLASCWSQHGWGPVSSASCRESDSVALVCFSWSTRCLPYFSAPLRPAQRLALCPWTRFLFRCETRSHPPGSPRSSPRHRPAAPAHPFPLLWTNILSLVPLYPSPSALGPVSPGPSCRGLPSISQQDLSPSQLEVPHHIPTSHFSSIYLFPLYLTPHFPFVEELFAWAVSNFSPTFFSFLHLVTKTVLLEVTGDVTLVMVSSGPHSSGGESLPSQWEVTCARPLPVCPFSR